MKEILKGQNQGERGNTKNHKPWLAQVKSYNMRSGICLKIPQQNNQNKKVCVRGDK